MTRSRQEAAIANKVELKAQLFVTSPIYTGSNCIWLIVLKPIGKSVCQFISHALSAYCTVCQHMVQISQLSVSGTVVSLSQPSSNDEPRVYCRESWDCMIPASLSVRRIPHLSLYQRWSLSDGPVGCLCIRSLMLCLSVYSLGILGRHACVETVQCTWDILNAPWEYLTWVK
jgi:hypothetical protein